MHKEKEENIIIERPPVVVIMGHIDHGKSTLLDYIRKTNIVDKEIGGITQRVSAYEVTHKRDKSNDDKKITFIDTPGHESFSGMRERGADIADIAVLIISAEDGVKPQTIEAWKTIQDKKMPVIVVINKIDKPNANIEKTKIELTENNILIESYGGQIPSIEISAKAGTGIDELLSLILLIAEMENFTGDENLNASGFVLETNLDPQRGIEATLIIKNGTLKKGMTVVVENTLCSTNIMENYKGETIDTASFSSPIKLAGFGDMPNIGAKFVSCKNKKEGEEFRCEWQEKNQLNNNVNKNQNINEDGVSKKLIPVILKADIAGSLEAIEKEISKIKADNAEFNIVQKGVGAIRESDIKNIITEDTIVIGFNVKIDKSAVDLGDKRGIDISCFNIIYKLTEWLEEEMEKKRPKIESEETTGQTKILKVFSKTKEKQILGGKVLKGKMVLDKTVKIIRRENEIGKGRIVNLEKNKTKVRDVEEGAEFGMMIESKIEIVSGDVLESFNITKK